MEYFRWGENWPIEPDHSRDVASAMAANRNRRRVMIAQAVEITALEIVNEGMWLAGLDRVRGGNPWGMDK